MAYQVDKFNGTFLVSVEDGTIDTTTDLRFVGKNYAGYGEVQNENFLHLLENFANTSAPPKVITGQIWYDSSSKKLKFYDGSRFRMAGGAEAAATAPSGLVTGDFWWDTSAKQLYTWSGTDFVLVGPEASPDLGASSIQAAVVKDTSNNNHSIVKIIAGGKTIAVVSQDAFALNTAINPINDTSSFTVIKKGVTLINTNGTTGVTSDDHYFWGTSSNSLKLGGVNADQFLQKGSLVFDQQIRFEDDGFTVGDQNDLRINVENGDEVIIENRLGNDITFRITVTETSDERDVAIFRSTGVVPGVNGTYNLGSSVLKWDNVYSNTTYSNLIGNVTGDLTGDISGTVKADDGVTVLINGTTKEIGYTGATIRGTLFGNVSGNVTGSSTSASLLGSYSPSIAVPGSVDKSSVPVRDADGKIYAEQFVGTADNADKLLVGSSYISASIAVPVSGDKTSIASRDSAGDLYAVLFQGTATAARYADLAEKYLADKEYEPGTVVMVGGEKEVTAADVNTRAIGVVSTNPAFMMNKDLEGGTYIALKGRVPVKVYGAVRKGDRLVAGPSGSAIAAHGNFANVFAVALETNGDADVKLVEAVIL